MQDQHPPSEQEVLSALRQKIDQLDADILEMLGKRMAVSSQVAAAKQQSTQFFRPGREAALLASLTGRNATLGDDLVRGVWRQILSASIARQKPDFTVGTSQDALVTAQYLAAGQLKLAAPTAPAAGFDLLDNRDIELLVLAEEEVMAFASLLGAEHGRYIQACYKQADGRRHFVIGRYLVDPSGDDISWVLAEDTSGNGFALLAENGYLEPLAYSAETKGRLVGYSALLPA